MSTTQVKPNFYKAVYLLNKGGVFNLCLSDRSDGKTFDCKFRALVDYLQNGKQSIYMRRYKSEITPELYENFFNEVLSKIDDLTPEERQALQGIDEYEFRGEKRRILTRKRGSKAWDTITYLVPLSMSTKLKSIFDISRITNIDLDEYIPLDLKYLKDEMTYITEFYQSIDRHRDVVKFNLFGNRVTAFNPFFDYFNISIDLTKNQIKGFKNNTVFVQIFSDENNRCIEDKTRFATATSGTKNDDYYKGGVLKNSIYRPNNINGCTALCSFKTELGEGSIYYGEKGLVVTTRQIKANYCIVDKIYNIENEIVVTFGKFGDMLKNYYRTGKLYYENERAVYIFQPVLSKVCVK